MSLPLHHVALATNVAPPPLILAARFWPAFCRCCCCCYHRSCSAGHILRVASTETRPRRVPAPRLSTRFRSHFPAGSGPMFLFCSAVLPLLFVFLGFCICFCFCLFLALDLAAVPRLRLPFVPAPAFTSAHPLSRPQPSLLPRPRFRPRGGTNEYTPPSPDPFTSTKPTHMPSLVCVSRCFRFLRQAEMFAVKRSTHSPVSSASTAPGTVRRKRVLVLYGSETGTAEGYAYQTAERLRSFACHVSARYT